ncbi:MAG: cytochrome P450 [Anaerolineae bacterium]|jgi:cytochrome P450|nr:cytochrome P450 [Anaerolineae bacterium]
MTLPGRSPATVISDLRWFRRDPLNFVRFLQSEYGEFARFYIGPFQACLVTQPEAVGTILQNADVYGMDWLLQGVLRPFVGNGIITTNGAEHRHARKLIAPAFHHSRLHQYTDFIVQYAQETIDEWQEGQVLHLQQVIPNLTFRVVVKALFNAHREDVGNPFDALTRTIQIFGETWRQPVPLPPWIPTKINRDTKRIIHQLDEVIMAIIRKHQDGQDHGDLISTLLNAVDQDGKPLSHRQIRDEVMTMFVAGQDSTGFTLSWALYHLSQDPAVQEQVEAEVAEVLGGRAPTFADLPRLTYTQMVIKEVLRLYPIAWMTSRAPNQDVELGGYTFKKNTLFYVSPFLNQHRPDFFPDPESFRPERFADEAEKKWPKYRYFPFGGGPRICAGQALAMLQATLILAMIVQQLDLTRVESTPVRPHAVAALGFDRPILMRVHHRERALAY